MSTETNANAPDGQMDDQKMPTTDGQMASGGSEEVVPPPARDEPTHDTPNGHD